jgi:hypothetical protein
MADEYFDAEDDSDQQGEGWSAPWTRGHIPDQAQRDEWAQLMCHMMHELTHRSRGGKRPSIDPSDVVSGRDARRAVWFLWHMVYGRQEFRDWFEGEQAAKNAAEDEARHRERLRRQRARQRKRQQPTPSM